jgi:c(7)-type cytochrome triheme protein
MHHLIKVFIIFASILVCAQVASARNRVQPQEYGRVIIANHSERAGLAPVVFDHWLHRAQFTCRLCHVDIGFAMKAGATNITAATNAQGFYCGTCHNGKRRYNGKTIFASCSESASRKDTGCALCHSLKKNIVKEHDFNAFAKEMPKKTFGNGIDWEAAEGSGLIKPIDFLEGISMQRPPMKTQKDFSIEANVTWISHVIFSHKKHAVWNGCEVCHPNIFPVKKGATKYTMLEIDEGEYCGVCHDKVAFPLLDCDRCHAGAMY